MSADVKPIETEYKGFRFRSRTEARWAVYFDAMGIDWEYEKEGYKLPNGKWYLPDFWLPQTSCWAEVKGASFTGEEATRCALLSLMTGRSVLMLDGPPDAVEYPSVTCTQGKLQRDEFEIFFESLDIHQIDYVKDEKRFYTTSEGGFLFHGDQSKLMIGEGELLSEIFEKSHRKAEPNSAIAAARSARFERGGVA